MDLIRLLFRSIVAFYDLLFLRIQLSFYFQTHTVQDLEERLMDLGCKRTVSHAGRIYTTANGVGHIVVTDREIWINPK